MKDMSLSPAEKQDYNEITPMKGPNYPYGLRIDLEKESLEKLGKNVSDFKMGDEFTIQAKVKVTSLNSSEHEDGDGHQSVGLQICEMEIEGNESKDDSERVNRMYGESDGDY